MFKVCVCRCVLVCVFCCDICNDLVVYCVGLAYDTGVSRSQMIDNKLDSHLKGLLIHYYYYIYRLLYF